MVRVVKERWCRATSCPGSSLGREKAPACTLHKLQLLSVERKRVLSHPIGAADQGFDRELRPSLAGTSPIVLAKGCLTIASHRSSGKTCCHGCKSDPFLFPTHLRQTGVAQAPLIHSTSSPISNQKRWRQIFDLFRICLSHQDCLPPNSSLKNSQKLHYG